MNPRILDPFLEFLLKRLPQIYAIIGKGGGDEEDNSGGVRRPGEKDSLPFCDIELNDERPTDP
jgi:hypothetical protein